jgi:hypothetical protein
MTFNPGQTIYLERAGRIVPVTVISDGAVLRVK